MLELQDGLRPRIEEAIAAEPLKGGRDLLEKMLLGVRPRVELLHLVERVPRPQARRWGSWSSPTRSSSAPGWPACGPRSAQEERAKFKVVLLDEYQDTSVAQALMLSHLFSGPTPAEGRGHPVTAVGDPNQAIYGWRGASVSNILRFGESFPSADGSTDAPSYSLTVNRRSDQRILDARQRARRPALRAVPDGAAAGVPADAADGRGARRGARDLRRGARRAGGAGAAPPASGHGAWKEIGVLTRDNAHAADVFKVLSEAEIPVEIVGLKGLLALPEVAEVVAMLTLLQDLTANAALLTLLTGPRWAIGPRDLALLGERAEELAGPRRRVPGRPGRSVDEELADAVAGADPTEVASLVRRARRPRRRRRTPPRRASGSRCSPTSCAGCASTPASRCSTWSAGSSTPPASTSSWPRR